MMKSEVSTPLGIYIHIPFCVRKCAYCDFLSAPAPDLTREAYVQELIREIRQWQSGEYTGSPVHGHWHLVSIFMGGGTPSILTGDQISRILRACLSPNERYDIPADVEMTVECNPGTVSAPQLQRMKESGVNRLSFGLQSADNRELVLLGRIHTWEQFQESYRLARNIGFDNINVDLMSGLPGQTCESWRRTLEAVLSLGNPEAEGYTETSIIRERTSLCQDSLPGMCNMAGKELSRSPEKRKAHSGPEHISAYSLIIEEGTAFYRLYHEEDERRARGEEYDLRGAAVEPGGVNRARGEEYGLSAGTAHLPSEEEERRMYYDTREILRSHGFSQYEISNYSLPGRACRHNIGYWTGRDYISFGLGATSRLGTVRYRNTSGLTDYLAHHHEPEETEYLTQKDDMEEMMFLGLRMNAGVGLEAFERRFHRSMREVYGRQMDRFMKEGFLQITRDEADGEHFLTLTDAGLDVSNAVMAEFML